MQSLLGGIIISNSRHTWLVCIFFLYLTFYNYCNLSFRYLIFNSIHYTVWNSNRYYAVPDCMTTFWYSEVRNRCPSRVYIYIKRESISRQYIMKRQVGLKAIVYSIGGFEWIPISLSKSVAFSLLTSESNLKPPWNQFKWEINVE